MGIFEYEVFSNYEHFYKHDRFVRLAASGMTLAHWLYLNGAIIDFLLGFCDSRQNELGASTDISSRPGVGVEDEDAEDALRRDGTMTGMSKALGKPTNNETSPDTTVV